MKNYLTQHGISEAVAETLELAYEEEKNRIAIPVKDIEGKFLFNKYRNLSHETDSEVPKFTYDAGSSAELYNIHNVKTSEYVFIFEGEPDVWKAVEDGIPAVCGTSGAGSFDPLWADALAGKKILVCYDNDPAGMAGAAKVVEVIPEALIIKLPEGIKDYCEYRKQYSIASFQDIARTLIKENTLSYDDLCQVIDKWLLLPDKNVLKVLFASLISHYFSADPLWIFLVAPPSGTKTELINLLSALPIVYMLSSLTEKTLFSGQRGKDGGESPSLMMRIPNSIITMKDFTSILSMRQEERMAILGQLREIYDGRYDRAFGTGLEIHWTGRVTLVAGVTGIIDAQRSLFQIMGERFIMYRVLQPNNREVARKAMLTSGREVEMRRELKQAMSKFFWGIKIPKMETITIPDGIVDCLASLASFIVVARSGTLRNQYGAKEIELIPEAEAPARLAKQLGVLIKALTVLAGRKEATWEEYFLTLKVALDTVPRNKLIHLTAVVEASGSIKTSDIIKKTGYSISGAELILEDLMALGLVDREGYGQGSTIYWELSKVGIEFIEEIVTEPIVLSHFSDNDFYHDFIAECLEKSELKKFRKVEEI